MRDVDIVSRQRDQAHAAEIFSSAGSTQVEQRGLDTTCLDRRLAEQDD